MLSEWLRAQQCAQEMLSLACGHLCVMRTSLLDLEADVSSEEEVRDTLVEGADAL